MLGEIIAIGDELISGRILNSTSSFAASHLFAAGHDIMAMTIIGDDLALIGEMLQRATGRVDFVIVTGGLGATTDDLTNEAVANAFDLPVVFHPEIFDKVNSGKKKAGTGAKGAAQDTVAGLAEKLAWLPKGAEVLKPEAHMAGHVLMLADTPIFFLPGVPYEMRELLVEVVIPRLATYKGQAAMAVEHKLYKLLGLEETTINEKLSRIEKEYDRAKIGYYPVFPEVHVSLTVRDADLKAAEDLFKKSDAAIEAALGDYIWGYDGDTLEGLVGSLLLKRGKTLATAESCTGGRVAQALTSVSGSSDYFIGGVVAYSNELKERFLEVDSGTLRKYGAVSATTAREMADGARKKTGADIAVSVTGIAGPTGGSEDKPIGTVYFGLATPEGTKDFLYHFRGGRWKIQRHAGHTALDLVRRYLLSNQ